MNGMNGGQWRKMENVEGGREKGVPSEGKEGTNDRRSTVGEEGGIPREGGGSAF